MLSLPINERFAYFCKRTFSNTISASSFRRIQILPRRRAPTCHHFEFIEEGTILSQHVLQNVQLVVFLLGCGGRLLLIQILLRALDKSLLFSQDCLLAIILHFLLLFQLPNLNVIFEPLILLLIPNEVGHEFPVARCFLSPIQQKVVSLVAKVGYHSHTLDLLIDVLQFFKAQS